MKTSIDPTLVYQINELLDAWTVAARRIREMLHGWERRAAMAGIERGFYIELAKLPGAEDFIDEETDDMEEAGRLVFAAYRRGGMVAVVDVPPYL